MTLAMPHLGRPLARLKRRFGRRPWIALLEAAARAGYVARGLVYLSVGTIAMLAALRLTPHARGALGALEAWAAWPLGVGLIWLVALGLCGFAGWRALQSVFDIDRCGTTPRALGVRAGQAISGLTYGGLAISVFSVIGAMAELREPDEQTATLAFVDSLLDQPFGPAMVIAMGLFVIAAGVGSMIRSAFDQFGKGLECRAEARAWADGVARFGYLGRGVALLPAGVLLVNAGWHARASEARGLGGALELLAGWPFGHAILGLTAAGLIAFGLFAVTEGVLRPMRLTT